MRRLRLLKLIAMIVIQISVPLKAMLGKIEEIKLIATRLGLSIDIVLSSYSNWILYVEVTLSIIVDSSDETQLNTFQQLIKQ